VKIQHFPLKDQWKMFFTYEELMSTAKGAGFCKRESKLNPYVFFDLMMYVASSAKPKSLETDFHRSPFCACL